MTMTQLAVWVAEKRLDWLSMRSYESVESFELQLV